MKNYFDKLTSEEQEYEKKSREHHRPCYANGGIRCGCGNGWCNQLPSRVSDNRWLLVKDLINSGVEIHEAECKVYGFDKHPLL